MYTPDEFEHDVELIQDEYDVEALMSERFAQERRQGADLFEYDTETYENQTPYGLKMSLDYLQVA